MAYMAVNRVAPRRKSSWKNRLEGHQLRKTVEAHIEADRTHLNRILVGSENIADDMQGVLDKYGIVDKRGVEGAEMILTAGVEYFDSISPNWRQGEYSNTFKKWVNLNVEWAKEKYGEGCVSMVLHMDETSPHIHLNLVPIATFEKKFRRGSKVMTKTHYSRHFSDPKSLLAKARKERNPELTKLGRLQTEYASAMSPVGLVRGSMGSDRRHKTSEEHRREVQKKIEQPKPQSKTPVPDATVIHTICDALGITTERDKIIALNKAERLRWIRDRKKHIKTLTAKAKEHDRIKSQEKNMQEASRKKDDDIKKLRSGLELRKSEIDALRKTDLKLVADKLVYEEELYTPEGKPRFKGAIDMVKEIAGLDYNDAVEFLHFELGSEFTKSSLTEAAIQEAELKVRQLDILAEVSSIAKPVERRKFTKQEYAIQKELAKQLDALNADSYRITCMSDSLPTYNVGKGKGPDGKEKLFTRAEVLQQVPKLNYENGARGYNIFLTPIDEMSQYILIDDMTDSTLNEVKALGITPCITQYSSEGNIQAVIRINGDEKIQPAANKYFKQLNTAYGDKNIQALRHPFRAVGFRNVKPKHKGPDGRYPIVKLIQTAMQSCQVALRAVVSLARDIAKAKTSEVSSNSQKRVYEALLADTRDVSILPELDQIAVKKYKTLAQKYGPDMNVSQADWMLCTDLINRGYSPDEIAAAVLKHSPNIEHRHKQLLDYVNRTVSNAVAEEGIKDYK